MLIVCHDNGIPGSYGYSEITSGESESSIYQRYQEEGITIYSIEKA